MTDRFAPEADPRFEMVGFSRTDDLKSRDERKYRLLQTSMDLSAAIAKGQIRAMDPQLICIT